MPRTLLAFLLALTISSPAESRRSRHEPSGEFDYYILALSWAPNYCATHPKNFNECGPGRRRAFVVHGLWPQGERGRLNQPCQHTQPVAQDVVRYALNFYPTAGLIRHEWQCHGVYSGLSPRDYFTAVGRAFQSLHIPPSISTFSTDAQQNSTTLIREFEHSNSAPQGSFVTSCHDGELVAVEACFTRDLKLLALALTLGGVCGGGEEVLEAVHRPGSYGSSNGADEDSAIGIGRAIGHGIYLSRLEAMATRGVA